MKLFSESGFDTIVSEVTMMFLLLFSVGFSHAILLASQVLKTQEYCRVERWKT